METLDCDEGLWMAFSEGVFEGYDEDEGVVDGLSDGIFKCNNTLGLLKEQ